MNLTFRQNTRHGKKQQDETDKDYGTCTNTDGNITGPNSRMFGTLCPYLEYSHFGWKRPWYGVMH